MAVVQHSSTPTAPTYPQMFGYLFGSVYLMVGIAGWVSTGHIGFTSAVGGREALFFSVNPLHNVAHLIIGAALLAAAIAGPQVARAAAIGLAAIYLLLAVAGPFITATPSANILGLNFADDVLHALTAGVALITVFVLNRYDDFAKA